MVLRKIARELRRPFRARRKPAASRVKTSQEMLLNPTSSIAATQSAPLRAYPPDFSPDDIEIIKAVAPFTMTSPERIVALVQAVEYLVRANIPGDIVECGVWKGGSMMAAALTLLRLGDGNRTLHLFDTFEGMPAPDEVDRDCYGASAAERLATHDRRTSVMWGMAQLDEVRRNIDKTRYSPDRLHFVVGRVEETVPREAPERIALLRLDTDWYESTRHDLAHLYHRLPPGGVIIIDDYGHWQGARNATDEFLATLARPPLLCRIDYTGRIAIKPD